MQSSGASSAEDFGKWRCFGVLACLPVQREAITGRAQTRVSSLLSGPALAAASHSFRRSVCSPAHLEECQSQARVNTLHEARHWPSCGVETWSAEGEEKVKSGYWATEVRDLAQRKVCCLCLPVAWSFGEELEACGFLLPCQLMTVTRLSSNSLILLFPDFTTEQFLFLVPTPQSSYSSGSCIWTQNPTTWVPPHPTVCHSLSLQFLVAT